MGLATKKASKKNFLFYDSFFVANPFVKQPTAQERV